MMMSLALPQASGISTSIIKEQLYYIFRGYASLILTPDKEINQG
jgi:hypothetical protein